MVRISYVQQFGVERIVTAEIASYLLNYCVNNNLMIRVSLVPFGLFFFVTNHVGRLFPLPASLRVSRKQERPFAQIPDSI